MSRLYFHTPSGDAELLGSERTWLRQLAQGPADAAWDLHGPHRRLERAEQILSMSPQPHPGSHAANYLHDYLREAREQDARNRDAYQAWADRRTQPGHANHDLEQRLVSALRIALHVDGLPLHVAGVDLHTTDVGLNTTLLAGSDLIRLAAKIDGWCEVHAWVEGGDRAWLADLIEQGLRAGIYRQGLWMDNPDSGARDKWAPMGWDQVVGLLRARDDEPAVMSYSVCDGFPNPDVAGWDPSIDASWRPDWAADSEGLADWRALDDSQRQWYRRQHAGELWSELPAGRRWEMAMDGLRRSRPWARLAPDTLAAQTFGPPVTVYDLFAPDRDERVRAAAASAGTPPACGDQSNIDTRAEGIPR